MVERSAGIVGPASFADVCVGYPVEGVFTYAVPEGLPVRVFSRVKVDFRGRIVTAFVLELHGKAPSGFEVKEIRSLIDESPIFDERLLDCARHVADNYFGSLGEALATALPSGERPSKRYRHPFAASPPRSIVLTGEQQAAHDAIMDSFGSGSAFHLLHGITGSGKTEVYMEIARRFIGEGASVIYLVPEISLSSQIFERLYEVFGEELIVYHSRLTAQQRLHNWMRFYAGDAKIAVGTRSAVFLQCPRLGAVIIDEEHDGSYKEHSTPRYNARRVAFYRCRKEGGLLLMGSATPSVESLYAAERGLLKLHTLKGRYGKAVLPEIEIVRLSSARPEAMLSTALKLHTKRAIDGGLQAIYLLNRRGFAPFVVCGECSAVLECPKCSISLNFHSDGNMLCHYCGYQRRLPEACPACGAERLEKVGSGTQRVEEIIAGTFHGSRIFRLDQDSSRKKDAIFDLIEKMRAGEIDILLGTQMVAKGFDFHNVAVVGVILADIGLNFPDFRASERVFSLLLQVAGRGGRGDVPGRVIIQTLNEDHYVFGFLKNHDYYGFYRHELSVRRALGYPPFSRITRLLARGPDEAAVEGAIARVAEVLREGLGGVPNATVLGPAKAPLARIGGNHRHHVIIKARDIESIRPALRMVGSERLPRGVYLEIDVDPFDML
ncbi:MAG: primosomal protein N' [Spirochaetes bacterium]|nr:primosomal protein N' [Spirochaetota bacterium]